MEEIELEDKNRDEEHQEDDRDEDSTDSNGSDDLLDNLNWLTSGGKVTRSEKTINKIFNDRVAEYHYTVDFFDTLLIERDIKKPMFIKHLMDNYEFSVKKVVTAFGDEYEVSYYGEPYVNDNNVSVRPFRRFKTDDGIIDDPDEMNQLVYDLRYQYDKWRKEEINNILKKSGLISGVAIIIIGLVTGLTLGLRRSGNDIKRDAKKRRKASKIKPGHKIIPWTDIEDVSGGTLIAVGDHLFLILGAGTVIYLLERK